MKQLTHDYDETLVKKARNVELFLTPFLARARFVQLGVLDCLPNPSTSLVVFQSVSPNLDNLPLLQPRTSNVVGEETGSYGEVSHVQWTGG